MKIEQFKHGSVCCFATQIHCQNSPRHPQLHNLFKSLKSIELHWFFVLQFCVGAAERARVAIDLKISLSCQKIYLCCSSILVFWFSASTFRSFVLLVVPVFIEFYSFLVPKTRGYTEFFDVFLVLECIFGVLNRVLLIFDKHLLFRAQNQRSKVYKSWTRPQLPRANR